MTVKISRGKRALLDLGLFYAALIWGATFFMVKEVLGDVHPVTLVGYRFLFSAVFMLPWVLKRKKPTKLLREGIVLGSLLMILYLSQTAGLQYTTASNSGFITGLFVFFVPCFLLVFFKKPPEPGQWAAVAIALTGLWLLTGGPAGFNRGDVLTVIAAMTYAGHLLATDKYVRADADPVLLAFHQFWFCGVACLLLSLAIGAPFAVKTTKALWVILFLTIFPNLTAFFIQMLAQKHTPPLKVSLIFSLEPVFAALFAWTLGGERFLLISAFGGALMFLAMILGELSRLRRPARRAERRAACRLFLGTFAGGPRGESPP